MLLSPTNVFSFSWTIILSSAAGLANGGMTDGVSMSDNSRVRRQLLWFTTLESRDRWTNTELQKEG